MTEPAKIKKAVKDPNFTGKWKLISYDGIDRYLKSEGWNWMMRKVISKLGNTYFIYHDKEKNNISTKSIDNSGISEFIEKATINGQQIEYIDKGGYKIKSTFKWNDDKTKIIENVSKITDHKIKIYTKYRYIDHNKQMITIRTNENNVSFSSIYIKQDISNTELQQLLSIHSEANDDDNDDIKDCNDTEHLKLKLIKYEKRLKELDEENKILREENKTLKIKNIEIMNDMNDEKKNDNDIYDGDDKKCKQKFKDWLCMKQYLSLFQQTQYNDIRLIQFFNDDILKNDIEIQKGLHRKLILLKVNEFKVLMNEFNVLLDNNKELKQYKAEFEKNGILTIKDLKNDIKSKDELSKMINIEKENTLNCLWEIIDNKDDDLLQQNEVEGQMTENH